MYSIIKNGGEAVVTVFGDGLDEPVVLKASHPGYEAVVEELFGAEALDQTPNYDYIRKQADVADAVATRFEAVTDRVSVANRRVYFDGDEVEGSIARAILDALGESHNAAQGLAWFLTKLAANPSANSRTQLYNFLDVHDFTITFNGDIVGYKGITEDNTSVNGGEAIVDGEVVRGRIPNRLNSVITMPRSKVEDNSGVSCASGLHVATHEYASGWGDKVVEVYVSPTDVVSVPDGEAEKVRVCRYRVGKVVEKAYSERYLDDDRVEYPADW